MSKSARKGPARFGPSKIVYTGGLRTELRNTRPIVRSMRRFMLRYPPANLEIYLSAYSILVGTWLIASWWTSLSQSDFHATIFASSVTREAAWGLWMFIAGSATLMSSVAQRNRWCRIGLFYQFCIWIFAAVMVSQTLHWTNIEIPSSFAAALGLGWCYLSRL